MTLLINLSFLLSKPTGITTYALNLLPHLQQLYPTLLVSRNISGYNCYLVPPNQTAEQGVKGHFNRLVWTQFQLPQIYRKLKSQILFSSLPEAPLYSNCRFVITCFDMIPLRFPKRFSPLTAYHRYYTPQVLKQAQHIICISETTAQDITNFYGIPANKITAIPLAYDRNHFRLLNLPTRNYFLYIGRQEPYKNIQGLIAAFAALPNYKDYELWLVGPSDRRYTPTLTAQVAELGITNQVKFLDYVPYDELPKIINEAIALVFPSLWEGFGLPVLEAMACGTPVITSNLSSLPEVAGDAAILIDPYNTGEITEAMQAIATNSGLRSRLSSQGITHCQQFSWEKTGKATVEVLSRYI
ncbi:mannosyltransferase [Nostoc sp. 'Peltigera membranacea cyanobiont' 213]|uniref:glycosyltransferase family 4 protein n=1 Tax=Nostoc sp. 'Peltigera membranacea cyanobiont' 213 TaxID=2014530 RepID=UPI000B95A6B5|nr:glycosyltransferase family 1 protein [Nostoc sp. 'Peltigera membranacea cyanobiont' 213]OYD93534.1 mannosyltransferase [Nostoc sp. 'Peltigera membranacea cyanobiont' 213]